MQLNQFSMDNFPTDGEGFERLRELVVETKGAVYMKGVPEAVMGSAARPATFYVNLRVAGKHRAEDVVALFGVMKEVYRG